MVLATPLGLGAESETPHLPRINEASYLFGVIHKSSSSSSFLLGRFSGARYKRTSRRLPSPLNPLAS
jgi:hypothetical protein